MHEERRPWVVLGAGRVGRMLVKFAQSCGIEVLATWNQSEARAKETQCVCPEVKCALSGPLSSALLGLQLQKHEAIVWVTVVDDAIELVVDALAGFVAPGSYVLHTSGSLSSSVFDTCLREREGVYVGSLHPLLSIVDIDQAVKEMAYCTWTVEGDAQVVSWCTDLLEYIGVSPVVIMADVKVLYHAAAVTSANLFVGLLDAAFAMASAAGIEDVQVQRAMFLPLVQSCLQNVRHKSTREALTGPAARGDEETIARHVEALVQLDDANLLEVYEVLTHRVRRLASTYDV